MITESGNLGGMELFIPSSEQVRALLEPLNMKQLDLLAELSGVPATTIYKIKRGETGNPGVETLRKFMPHVASAQHPAPELVDAQQEAASLSPHAQPPRVSESQSECGLARGRNAPGPFFGV